MAGALAKLASEYNLGVSGKVSAWLNVATVMGPIVGAHYMAYRMRLMAVPHQMAPSAPIPMGAFRQ